MLLRKKLNAYSHLIRLDKPIGILLLLWPSLWALWLASSGLPDMTILSIFILGVILMRSAGCAFNDYADRHLDAHVTRTANRVLAQGIIKPQEALLVAAMLVFFAFLLILFCRPLTIALAFIGVGLSIFYPFMKRLIAVPQIILGFAFAWGVPMAFAEVRNEISSDALLVYSAALLMPVIYDTFYAMVDREDDKKIKIKSMAIWLGDYDKLVLLVLQILLALLLFALGFQFELRLIYFVMVSLACLLLVYQQWLIKDRDPDLCFRAFLNFNWVGALVFVGIAASFAGFAL